VKTTLIGTAVLIATLPLAAQVATTTRLSLSDTSPVVAETLMLRAQVTPMLPVPPQVTADPTGVVRFYTGSLILGTTSIDMNGVAQATVQFPSPGRYELQAVYSGDTYYAGSTSLAVVVVVTQGFSSVSQIQTFPPRPVAGQSVALAVQVSAQPPLTLTPRGTVTFFDSGIPLGAVQLDGAGNAQISATFLPGTHYISASYGGDVNFAGSGSPVLQLVVQNSFTITSLGADPSNAGVGQTITFKATVSAAGSGGVGLPTGSVSFMEGAATLGRVALNGSSATFPTSLLAAGLHIVTAVYSGDATFGSSTSGPVAVTVRAAPQVTLVFSEGAGGLVLTSTVTGSGAAPTGTVQFNDVGAGKTLATKTLAGGSAGAILNPAPAGLTVQAVYSGDSNYPGASSSPQALIVVTSGFSAAFATFAPDEFATIFGAALAATAASAPQPPPTILGGLTVTITDASGANHAALLLYVSATQVNFIVPADTPAGPATLTLSGAGFSALLGPAKVSITIANVSPALAPVGQVIRVHSNSVAESPVLTANFDAGSQTWLPVPIPFGQSSTDTLYLVLYGTGFRHAHGSTTCSANGQALNVQYSGAQGAFPALDQINAVVPASLQSAGQVLLSCSVDGQTSNPMTLVFQ
jgi:large repetitive protein